MATTEEYKNGGSASYSFSIEYIKAEDIKVTVDGTDLTYTATNPPAQTTEYTVNGSNVIFKQASVSGSTNGGVRIYRETDLGNSDSVTFQAGSSIRAADLNANHRLVRFSAQEKNQEITTADIRDSAVTSQKIKDLTIVDADIAAAAEIEVYKLKDGGANQVLVTQSDGTTVGWSSSVDLGGTLDVTGNVDFDANLNVDGNLEVDGTTNLDNTNIAGDLYVVGTALVDNVLIDGSSIESGSGNLNLSATGGSNVTVNDNLAVTGTLNVTQGVTLQNATATVNGSQIVTETASQTLTNKTLTTPVINDMSGTAVVTSGTSSSDTKVYSAKRAEERFYGKDTVGEIQSGETWSSADDKVATTAAIDARIIDLVDDVGGFVPIANETSFPTTNPDINTSGSAKGGTIVSVKTASTNLVPSGTTVTIANGRGSGLAVIITGVPSTIPSGFGFLVETTATDHTYAFHRLTPKATEVTTVATNATQVQTVHNNITQVQTVHNNITDIVAVANDATDIGTVAARDTEIGRLGTADAVADMAILGTTDVVSDLNTLGTADVVADMNMLATSDVIADMNMLAVSDVISDMNDLATSGNITAMSTCSTNIASINNASSNISSVNNFGDKYQVASNNPSTDGGGNALAAGDLYFNTSANELKVYNGSSWQGGVTATGTFASTTGNTFTGDNRYNDNVKALFGTGSDLEIFHDGGNSRIVDAGNGKLMIDSNGAGTDIRKNASENMAKFITDGAVELYYDNSKKFETASAGVKIDSYLELFHYGGSNFIRPNNGSLNIITPSSGNNIARFIPGGAVELWHNGSKKLETTSSGVTVTGTVAATSYTGDGSNLTGINTDLISDTTPQLGGNLDTNGKNINFGDSGGTTDDRLNFGASTDFSIYHDGTDNRIQSATGALRVLSADFRVMNAANTETQIKAVQNGSVQLYHNNTLSLETGTASHYGSVIARNGANGWDGYTVADHVLMGRTSDGSCGLFNDTDDKWTFKAFRNAQIELYYNGSKKLETASDKINFHAHAKVNADATYDLGASGARWNDLYIANNIYLKDAGEVRLGDSGDLQLYHDGNNSVINDTGTGRLKLISNNVQIRNAANTETIAEFIEDGAVELYHNGTKKFETISSGVSTDGLMNFNGTGGKILLADNGKLEFGGGTDMQIYHYNGDNYINIQYDQELRLTHGSEYLARFIAEGQNRFYYDHSTKAETTSTGFMVNGHLDLVDGDRLRLGSSQDLQIVHDGNHSYIEDTGTGSLVLKSSEVSIQSANGLENIATFTQDSVCRLYENSALKFQTGSGGHYGSVEAKTGQNGWSGFSIGGYYVFMANNEGNADTTGIFNDLDDEWMSRYTRNGKAELFYNGSTKIETTSIGGKITGGLNIDGGDNNHTGDAIVYIHGNNNSDWGLIVDADSNGKSDYGAKVVAPTSAGYAFAVAGVASGSQTINFLIDGNGNVDKSGHIYPSSSNSMDLGSTSARWRNVYTNDLHLSNEGHTNDVDGTWGNWTIQEGESDLFLKNNRSGKKYKFNLTEVS